MSHPETRVLTAHVPIDLARKLDEFAEKSDRSKAWILKQALSSWLAQEEERHRLTLEALEDVDAERLIDHEAVQAWADSLGSENPQPVPR